jgi:hypothetical protein
VARATFSIGHYIARMSKQGLFYEPASIDLSLETSVIARVWAPESLSSESHLAPGIVSTLVGMEIQSRPSCVTVAELSTKGHVGSQTTVEGV